MAFSSSYSHSTLSLKIDLFRKHIRPCNFSRTDQRFTLSLQSRSTELLGKQVVTHRTNIHGGWSFMGGSRVVIVPKLERFVKHQMGPPISASWFANSQIASSVFSIGTVAVLPFYALMVLAPKSELTRKSMQTSLPYIVLGILYAYLLYLSWTPETIKMIFSNKYMLPELQSIAKMFSSEMTLASAWIHLLVIDLFAARQVFHDGQENQVETRHSVSLCLLFCPIGVLSHFVTKALTGSSGHRGMH